MLRALYAVVLAAGIASFITIYFYSFDKYSEEELIKLSFQWAVPILFGLAGLAAELLPQSKNSLTIAVLVAALGAMALAGGLFVYFG